MAGIAVTCHSGAFLRSRVSENNGVSLVHYDGLRLAHRMQIPSATSMQSRYISASGKSPFSLLLILVFKPING